MPLQCSLDTGISSSSVVKNVRTHVRGMEKECTIDMSWRAVDSRWLLAFSIGRQYALHLAAVERVEQAVEITPLPKCPNIVLGVINVHENILPVVNVRRRFRLPDRAIEPSDRMIVAVTPRRRVVLLVDSVIGIVKRAADDITAAEAIAPHIEYIDGVAKLDDDLLFIHDLDSFLSLDEEENLDLALNSMESSKHE